MIHIQNQFFSAAIRLEGAELASLIEKSSGREIIWQADPKIWGSSAPILFPIVVNLKDGQTTINGKTYNIPKHGVLRGQPATVLEQGDDFVTLQFNSTPHSLVLYPYPFIFSVTFRLTDNELTVEYRVENSGEEPMLFSVGSHPRLCLEFGKSSPIRPCP